MKRIWKAFILILCAAMCLAVPACKENPTLNPHLVNGEKEWRGAFATELFENVKLDICDEEEGETVNPREMIIAEGRTYYKTQTKEYYTEIVSGKKYCYVKTGERWAADSLDRTESMVNQILSHVDDFNRFVYRSDLGGYVPQEDTGTLYVISFLNGKISQVRSNVVGTMRIINLTYGGQSIERPAGLTPLGS